MRTPVKGRVESSNLSRGVMTLIINDNMVCHCGAYYNADGFCSNGHHIQELELLHIHRKQDDY